MVKYFFMHENREKAMNLYLLGEGGLVISDSTWLAISDSTTRKITKILVIFSFEKIKFSPKVHPAG